MKIGYPDALEAVWLPSRLIFISYAGTKALELLILPSLQPVVSGDALCLLSADRSFVASVVFWFLRLRVSL